MYTIFILFVQGMAVYSAPPITELFLDCVMTHNTEVRYAKSVVMIEHEYASEMPPHRFQLHCKCKAIPLQDSTGPEGSRRVRFPDFKNIGT